MLENRDYLLKKLSVARQSMGCLEGGPTAISVYIAAFFFRPSKLLSGSICKLTISVDEPKIGEGVI